MISLEQLTYPTFRKCSKSGGMLKLNERGGDRVLKIFLEIIQVKYTLEMLHIP